MVETQLVTSQMVKQFSDPNEDVMYASTTKKRSTYGYGQQRVLIVTEHRIYLFED